MLIYMMEVPSFDPDEAGPAYIYALVADHIEARIEAGELVPGARLPGERDLAAEYQVALGTMRRAIEELRSRGLVVTLPAKGTFVVAQ
jgi:GntR family transcriptional regulator